VNLVRVIVITFSITTLVLGQSIFVEPVISISRLNNTDFAYGVIGNYGTHLGINFASKYDIYFGYKLMGDNACGFDQGIDYDAEITCQTYVIGARYYIYIRGDVLPLRLGLEYSQESVEESANYLMFLSDDLSARLNGNAVGYAIEGGFVYKKWKTFQIFLGANYRFCNYDIENIILNDDSIALSEFESKVGLKTHDVSRIDLTASVIVYPFRKKQ
jgi:hypothetical protein